MQKIPLMRAKAGMTLARDVFRSDSQGGIPICGKGTELTDALITRFDNMDVQTVYVEGHPIWEEGERTLQQYLDELDIRFSKSLHEPHNVILYEIYKSHLTKSMEDNGDGQAE